METRDYICLGKTNFAVLDKGDSGDPLIRKIYLHEPILIGVASSLLPMDINSPSLYIRVSSYLAWIRDNSGVVYYKNKHQAFIN